MSSREIAEYTGKGHDNILRDVRKMFADLGIDVLSFEAMSPDSYGRPQKIFNLPKDLTLTLVAGYSAPMRHAIVKRWLELEITAPSFGAMSCMTPAPCLPSLILTQRTFPLSTK